MTMRVMQVLHQGGGAGSVTSTLHLSLGLARRGVHVRFVCPPDSEVERLAHDGGLEVHPLRLGRGERRRNARELRALLRAAPVDLVNSQSARDREALTWLALARQLPVPLVMTRRQMPRTFVVENWLASRAAARVVAVSGAVGDALVRRGTPRRKLAVIPNGLVADRVDGEVAPGAIDAWRRTIGWEPSRRTVGIVARRKDQDIVVRALSQVTTPVRLVLAGLEHPDAMASLVAAVPSRHAVVTLPFAADVRPLYQLLDLVLLPSRMEGLSQGLLEAMALGKPVAASAAAGNPELVTDGVDGRLVAPLAPAAWAAVIDELLGDAALAHRLGAAARATARQRFALSHTVERTLALYRAVLDGTKFLSDLPRGERAVS